MATYRVDIEYIEESEPGLIERNAAEFLRMGRLLDSVEPDITRASHIEWESVTREKFDTRVQEAKSLISNLSLGFQDAGFALIAYSDGVRKAKDTVTTGVAAYHALRRVLDDGQSLLLYMGLPRRDDPMRQYEEMGAGFTWSLSFDRGLPRFNDLTDDAKRLYEQADEAFEKARSTEESARADCLAKLGNVRAALPEFGDLFGGDFRAAHDLAAEIEALQAELAEASTDENISLPGAGEKDYSWPTDQEGDVSTKLAEINGLAAGQQQASDLYRDYAWIPGYEREWVRNNHALIADIAARSGIPPDMLAAILLQESDDGAVNDIVESGRSWGVLPGDPDATSFGAMEVQIRRAADVLGYDPDPQHLTDGQRDQIVSALKDPVRSLYIASEYLERLKAGSDFANVPAAEMTEKNYRELAQMYNCGPGWDSTDGKKYGSEFMGNSLPAARDALG
jgi:hypothetical protein